MSEKHCYQCDAYRIRLEQLRAENKRLKAENKQLKRLVNRIAQYCSQLVHITRQTLQKRSGVKRGQWIFAKAGYQVATQILEIIRE